MLPLGKFHTSTSRLRGVGHLRGSLQLPLHFQDIQYTIHHLDHLDETGGAVAIQIGDKKTVLLRESQLLQRGLEEFEGGSLGTFGLGDLVRIDFEILFGDGGIIDGEQWVTIPETIPQRSHGIGVALRSILLLHLLQMGLEVGDLRQALFEIHTALIDGFTAATVYNVVLGDRSASHDGGLDHLDYFPPPSGIKPGLLIGAPTRVCYWRGEEKGERRGERVGSIIRSAQQTRGRRGRSDRTRRETEQRRRA